MLSVTFFKQPERLVFVAETRINSPKRIKIDVSDARTSPLILGRSLARRPACPRPHKPNQGRPQRTGSLLLQPCPDRQSCRIQQGLADTCVSLHMPKIAGYESPEGLD